MGYYASYGGSIKFKTDLPEEIIKLGKNEFEEFNYDHKTREADIYGYDKYYEDSIYETLEKMKPFVESGEIRYRGEDDIFWKFLFKNNEWAEENGEVYYDSDLPQIHTNSDKLEFLGSIIDIFEVFLEEKKVWWENDEREDESAALFYGTEYGEIESKLEELMQSWKILK